MNIFTKTVAEGKAIQCTSVPALDVVAHELEEDHVIWKDNNTIRDKFLAELDEQNFTIYILKEDTASKDLTVYWTYDCPNNIEVMSYIDLLLM